MSDVTPEKSFEELKTNVISEIASNFPYKGAARSLELVDIRADDKLAIDDIKSQTDAKVRERTWGVPIVGNMRLRDNKTGKVIDEQKVTLARIPKLTSRYSYIVDGNEYQVDNLFRLKSGIYARVQDNGDLESEFNLAKSPTGRGFSIKLDRKKKAFTVKMDGSHIPLYPIMKAMGVSDDDIEKSWGKELFNINKTDERRSVSSLQKLWGKIKEGEPPTELGKLHVGVGEHFEGSLLKPETTKLTLGKGFESVTGEALNMASAKLLGVSRGTHEPDDRDSLAFKEIASAEDFLPEAIRKSRRAVQAKLKNTINHKNSVVEIINPDTFKRPIHDFFAKGGGISERSEQTNPLTMFSGHRKTTLVAKEQGGIKDSHSLTDAMAMVNPSHFGFLDPIHTPEGERTGITLYMGLGTKKVGKDLITPAYDMKAGKVVPVNASDFHGAMAVLPDQVTWKNGKPVPVGPMVKMKLPGGAIEVRPYKDATYVMPSSRGMFNATTNLIPFLTSDQGTRAQMACKQVEQAISIKHREAPLVQVQSDHPDWTFERVFGSFTGHKAPVDGKVVDVKEDTVIISDGKKKHSVHLYNNFPLNDPRTLLHSTSIVKVGDPVKRGQVVADTNFTKKGVLALGANLRVGYLPYKGYNFEDGIVISETAAKKLTSEHLYRKTLDVDPDSDIVKKSTWLAHASLQPNNMKPVQLDALDEHGVVKEGTIIEKGQVLVTALAKNDLSNLRAKDPLAPLGKRARTPWKDKSLVWDEDYPGKVTRVIKDPGGRGYKVFIRTEEPMQIGDKMTGRHANKGIVTQILPDDKMPFTIDPHTKERTALEVILNPSGIPTRMNVGQVLEVGAAKIAQKTGETYVVNNFPGSTHDHREHVMADMKKHGISDEEIVYDPDNPSKALGSVLVGPSYLVKLRQQVDKKLAVRGGGTSLSGAKLGYDVNKQPIKGGDTSAQGFGQLELYAMLAHNARHNIREMSTYKSDEQDTRFWTMIQEGYQPPPPKVPFSYTKFEGMLKAMGVNVTKNGTNIRLMPMTDKEIIALAGHGNEITDGTKTLQSKNLKEEKGGLFDPHITGGMVGTKWSYLRMSEAMPNPIFVGEGNRQGPVPALLGVKIKDIDEIMAGRMKLHGLTGGAAIEDALKKINVKAELEATKKELPHLTGSKLDRANKKMRALAVLEEKGVSANEAYMLKVLPIMPPVSRQVTPTPRGDLHSAPINNLYKNFAALNDKLKAFDPKTFPEHHAHPIREQMWDAFKAIQSVGDYKPVTESDRPGSKRELKGIMEQIGGNQPKEGYFQSKVIKRRQSLSIRSTIIPEPALHIDEVGIPKGPAMELYKPFVVAKLKNSGYAPLDAQKMMKDPTNKAAFAALEKVMQERPLILKRDPVLHKFGVMAFKPIPVEGKAIKIHPLVCGGYNADFDGDTMGGTVPMSNEAIEEAKKLFPSKNLFSPTKGDIMYAPGHEALLGLHLLSKWGKATGKSYASVKELEASVHKGEAHPTDIVKVTGFKQPTSLGRILIEAQMPRGYAQNQAILHDPDFLLTKKTLKKTLLTPLAKSQHPVDFTNAVDSLKNVGNEWSYRLGFSFGLKDFAPPAAREKILKDADKLADHARKNIKNKTDLNEKIIDIYQDATNKIENDQVSQLEHGTNNRLVQMVMTGSRGESNQLRQMISAPMLLQDASGKIVPTPVKRSYAEGLDVGDYWITQHGARKGIIQRTKGSSEPGAIAKDIINTTMSTLVVSRDCGTRQGVLMKLTDDDIHDRYLAMDYKLKNGKTVKTGTLLDPGIINHLQNSKHDKVLVRSPLKCQHGTGICAKCFGLNESGVPHEEGTNIGILAGQALGEPVMQMSMDSFHSGGVGQGRGAASMGRLDRVTQLIEVPKKLKDAATIARAAGKITNIKPSTLGGVDIHIGSDVHYVPEHLVNKELSVGQEVKKGETLSHHTAPINPRDLLAVTKDIHAVQNYLTNSLYNEVYKKEGVRRRNIEVVVRAITNLTRVKDPGSAHDWVHGDVVPRSLVEEHNRNLPQGGKPIEHEPVLHGVTQIPTTVSRDWLARLNYQQLSKTLQEGAAQGWKSDLHGSHPIPGIAYGAEFGRPPADRSKHNY